jgi:hypothetical protein
MLARVAQRVAAARSVPTLARPALARGMADVAAPDTSGRTPERTAELERLAEEHNGFLFGEVPLPEGQSRQWQDWEYSYVPLMLSAWVIYGVAYYYRCAALPPPLPLLAIAPVLPLAPSVPLPPELPACVCADGFVAPSLCPRSSVQSEAECSIGGAHRGAQAPGGGWRCRGVSE